MADYTVKMPTDPKLFTGRQVIAMSKGDVESSYNVVANFIFDADDNKVSHEDGLEFLLDLNMYEFEAIMQTLNDSVLEADSKN